MIQWYPGHMAKTKREIKENLSHVDIVFLILDARVPKSSLNPDIKSLVDSKPILYLFNKASLADLKTLDDIIEEDNLKDYLIIDSLSGRNFNKIKSKAVDMLSSYIDKQKQKGYKHAIIKAMVLGIPNVGKSTFINRIANKKIASTDAHPGHTRALQWVRLDKDLHLLDTPGVLWPKFDDELTAVNLVLLGAIKESLLPKERLAKEGFNFMNNYYTFVLKRFYEIDEEDPQMFFEALSKKRGFLLEQTTLDLDKAYTLFLNDLKSGKLGGVCFDRPL